MKAILPAARFVVLLLLLPGLAQAATINTNCTAQIQSTGACGSGDAGETGVLMAYWVSLIDNAPADADVASDAVDLRDGLCSYFGITTCTTAAADGALRRFLEDLVKQLRRAKKEAGLPAPVNPVLDAQANP